MKPFWIVVAAIALAGCSGSEPIVVHPNTRQAGPVPISRSDLLPFAGNCQVGDDTYYSEDGNEFQYSGTIVAFLEGRQFNLRLSDGTISTADRDRWIEGGKFYVFRERKH